MSEWSGNVRYIRVDDVTDGMKLAQNVIAPCGKTLLLKDLILRAHFVPGLKQYQITHVLIYNDAKAAPNLQLLSPQTKLKAIDIAKKLFDDVKLGRFLNSNHITVVVREMVDELLAQTQHLICLHRMGTVEEYLIEHSINTTIISNVIGLRCGFPREKLIALAKAAFLHDIGKTKVPPAILNKPGTLTTDEFESVKLHPQHGFNLIREMPDSTMQIAMVSLQHHEKYNGDGYPIKLANGQIHDFSRIVAISDVYDALTTDRCYRPGLPPDQALEMMSKDRGTHFDPYLYDIFANAVVKYPVGTFVEMTDGTVGSVVALTKDINKPEVILFRVDNEGSVVDRRINLIKEVNLSIRSSI
jgi:HD-GYP domain-containing protein (c-di-GMP phosphodiesterase class II)